jgi:hypothetical protein
VAQSEHQRAYFMMNGRAVRGDGSAHALLRRALRRDTCVCAIGVRQRASLGAAMTNAPCAENQFLFLGCANLVRRCTREWNMRLTCGGRAEPFVNYV